MTVTGQGRKNMISIKWQQELTRGVRFLESRGKGVAPRIFLYAIAIL